MFLDETFLKESFFQIIFKELSNLKFFEKMGFPPTIYLIRCPLHNIPEVGDEMFYFSPILGKSVKTEDGEHIGRVWDMIIIPGESFPRISEIIQKQSSTLKRIPWERVKHLDHEGVIIRGKDLNFPDFKLDGEILLGRDILDKQIVDTNGRRVVRVNDIQLNMVGNDLRLAGVDVGTPGLLRRMELLEVFEKISRILKLKTPTNIISWDSVQTLGGSDSPIRLTTSYQKLTRLHPADLADILEDLSSVQRANLFSSLDTETAAETMEHLEDEIQLAVFSSLPDEKASDILEEMSSDDAVDLLRDLPEDKANKLLSLMEPEEAEGVRELLSYEKNTAGSFMNTEFIAASPEMTCQETIDHIRKLSPEAELVYYIYVTDEINHLKGVLSLRDIIVNDPSKRLEEFMIREIFSVKDEDLVDEAVELIAKYDLLAVPVLDKEEELKGIITFDDVMDLLMPKEWRGAISSR